MSAKTTVSMIAILAGAAMAFGAQAWAGDFKARNIKMAIVNPIEHPQGVGAQKFAEELEKRTEGKTKLKIFANGTLGGEQQVASAMQGGTIDVSSMAPAQLVGMIKQFVVLDFPFAFASDAQADAVLDGPFGKKLMGLLNEKNLVGLGFQHQGYRSISNSKRPIVKMEDIEGLKIRTILNPLYVDMLKTLGANPVPMPFPELYTALETGTVDGQENPEQTVEASKFYEVQKYFSADKHIYNTQMLMVSKKLWDSLSDDEKKAFQAASDEASVYQRKIARGLVEKSREFLTSKGMRLNEIAPEEIARMRTKVQPVIDKYTAEVGTELVTEFYAELKKTENLK